MQTMKREEHNDFGKRKGVRTKRELRIKRTAKSNEKKAPRLKQQEIFIPQWPELAI